MYLRSRCAPHRIPTCAIIHNMKFRPKSRILDVESEDASVAEPLPLVQNEQKKEVEDDDESTLIKTIGWVSAGLGAVALGLFIGREMRLRYKFNRRTPYDLYSHSGDEQDLDVGLGI
jgi:hypothetical protein